jgi:hypothetical protein
MAIPPAQRFCALKFSPNRGSAPFTFHAVDDEPSGPREHSLISIAVQLAHPAGRRGGAWRNCHHSFVDQCRKASATFCRTSYKSHAGMRAYRSR